MRRPAPSRIRLRTVVIGNALLVAIPLAVALGLYAAGWEVARLKVLLLLLFGFECFALLVPSTWVPSGSLTRTVSSASELNEVMREKRVEANRPWGLELLVIGPGLGLAVLAAGYFLGR